MKYTISLLLLITTLFCKGQTNQFFGLWVGAAEYRVENIFHVYDGFEDLIPFDEDGEIDSVALKEQIKADSIKRANWYLERDPVKIDTNYYEANILLDLRENGLAVYKELGEPERNINWFPTSNQNEIRLDTLPLRLDSTNHLSLVFYDQDSLKTKILFEPLSKSQISANSDIGSILKRHSWDFSNVDDPNKTQTSLYFENDTLSISIHNIDSTTFSSPANWMIDEFSGHYFLFVRQNFFDFCLHLIELQDSNTPTIKTDFYALKGFPFRTTEYPKLVNYRLTGSKLPKQKELNKIAKNLIGTWKSIDTAFPVDSIYFNQELLSSFLTYEFRNDGTVKAHFGGEVKDNYGTDQIDRIETFNWSLSSGGNLIIFDRAASSRDLAYFRFLDSEIIELRKEMQSLEGHHVVNMTFRMKRVK